MKTLSGPVRGIAPNYQCSIAEYLTIVSFAIDQKRAKHLLELYDLTNGPSVTILDLDEINTLVFQKKVE